MAADTGPVAETAAAAGSAASEARQVGRRAPSLRPAVHFLPVSHLHDEDEEDWDSGDSMESLEEIALSENKPSAAKETKPRTSTEKFPTESEERMAKTLRDTEEHMARLITERKEMEEKINNILHIGYNLY